jgi:hypothetical protein
MVALYALESAPAFAAVAVLFVCAIVSFQALSLAERRLAGWARPQPGENR